MNNIEHILSANLYIYSQIRIFIQSIVFKETINMFDLWTNCWSPGQAQIRPFLIRYLIPFLVQY